MTELEKKLWEMMIDTEATLPTQIKYNEPVKQLNHPYNR